MYMYSINYLHSGFPKIWYSIPLTEKKKFDEYAKLKYGLLKEKEGPGFKYKLSI